ncbi:MAG: glycosyltransferase family 4 protein [Bacteroidales bacterium]
MGKKSIIVFVNSDNSERYGLFHASHNRIKEMLNIGISLSVYSVKTYHTPFVNIVREILGKPKKVKGSSGFVYDSVEYKHLWYEQGLIGYLLEKMGFPEYTINRSLKIVDNDNASFVLSHWGLEPALWGLLYSKRWDIPFATTYHGSDINYAPRCWRRVQRIILSSSNHNFFVSEYLLNRAKSLYGAVNNPYVSYNGVDKICGSLTKHRPKIITIGFAGTLTSVKGADRLVPIASGLISSGIEFRLRVAGEGLLLDKIKEDSHKDNLPIELLGKLDSKLMSSFYESIDLLVIPSRNEGLPMVMLESLNRGTPVVACNVGGISEFLPKGCLVNINNLSENEIINEITNCCKRVLSYNDQVKPIRIISNWEEVVRDELNELNIN